MTSQTPQPPPLAGITVVDASRMLPGAVLARTLIDLGARWIKVEDPRGGDPMRHGQPRRGSMSVGFATFFRGAQSLALNLRSPQSAAAAARVIARADVFVESFRPGTLGRWGLGPEELTQRHPRLTVCSLPGFPTDTQSPVSVGHDLNFAAQSGLLTALRSEGVPGVQVIDVTTGLLAATAVTTALLARAATGRGRRIIQPLAASPLPFLTWSYADLAAHGRVGIPETLIGGRAPSYQVYRCADDLELAVGCVEPKFWLGFCEAVGRPDLAGAGPDTGDAGRAATDAMAAHLRTHARSHWLTRLQGLDLPVTAVQDAARGRQDPVFAHPGLCEETPMPQGDALPTPGPYVGSLGRTPEGPAPVLGQHTRPILEEVGLSGSEIDGLAVH